MSLFGKIFGGKKKEADPTPEEALQKLRGIEEMLEKKQDFLEKKVLEEKANAVKYGTKNKRMALQCLNRKRNVEKQLAHIDGVLATIGFQREALENGSTNAEVLNVMSQASKALKSAQNNMDIDQVHSLMEDIAEQQQVANEIAEAISNPIGFSSGVDDADLTRELEDLEQEELDNELLNARAPPVALPNTPSVALPSVPSVSTPKSRATVAADKDLEDLESWANA